ncbi:MAG: divalent-cation tolerance protein CutA [Candidatus Acidiferrales bacterium]
MATNKRIVLVTCGSAREAGKIARAVVHQRLAACANIVEAQILSIYRWKGRVESAREVLLIIKTTRSRLPALERAIRSLHCYEVPEIIALEVAAGSKNYLAWIEQSVRKPNPQRTSR